MNLTQEPKYTIKLDPVTLEARLVNVATGVPIPADEPIFILRAKDRYAADALSYYAGMVNDTHHYAAVTARIYQFREWAKANPEKIKEPDTATGFRFNDLSPQPQIDRGGGERPALNPAAARPFPKPRLIGGDDNT